MTTFVFNGPSILTNIANDPDGVATGFSANDTLEFVVRDHISTFSYSPRPLEENQILPIFMKLDTGAMTVRHSGQPVETKPGLVLVFNTDWDDNGTTRNTTLMALSLPLSKTLFVDYLFRLQGDDLPTFVKSTEIDTFFETQVDPFSFAAPSGAWAADTNIPFLSVPDVTTSENDLIEMEYVRGETAKSGAGNDTIMGDGFDETLSGGSGDDYIDADIGDDSLLGGKGEDTILGGFGDDSLLGGGQSDTLDGQGGDDQIYGGGGGDLGIGGDGFDSIYGGKGNDTLTGGADADFLNGEAGNDVLEGNFGLDTIWGGAGHDTISGGVGEDEISGGNGDDVIGGGAGNDTVYAANGADSIDAGADNDVVYSGEGDDTVDGGNGDDEVYAFTGDDNIDGGLGNDTIYAGLGNDTVTGGGGANEIYLAGGADEFIFASGQDTVFDFSVAQGDIIDLSGLAGVDGFNDLGLNHATDTAAGLLIDNDLGSTLLLSGLEWSDLTIDEFIFI
ncbi:MAG: calcium-binding protein [Paracoccaceae bacterium]